MSASLVGDESGCPRPHRTEGTERRSPSGGASLPELRCGAKAGRQPRRRLGTGSRYKHLPTHEPAPLRGAGECVGARIPQTGVQ